MRKINVLFIFIAGLFALSAFAGTCYKQALFYGCSNASGTTCTKVTVTALIPDTATALSSCPYVVESGAEYSAFLQYNNTLNGLTNNYNTLQNQQNSFSTSLTTTNSNVSALSSSLSALQTTVNNWNTSLTGWDSKIAANTQAVGTLNQILNEPFDLPTGMAAFAFFFSTTLFFYGVSRGAGAILEMIRRPMGRG